MKASKYIFPALLILIGAWLASYTFNEKADLNGDNYNYYVYATSLASGQGYCDLASPDQHPTNNFPPGYPLLMMPLRLMTDSIVAQKVLNEALVIVGILLTYLLLLRLGMKRSYAFVLAGVGLFCPRVFHFSTMMMSEASFFATSVLVAYALARMLDEKQLDGSLFSTQRLRTLLADRWLWVMLVALVLNYHIRTQGLALVAGTFCFLLFTRRWLTTLISGIVFVIGCLPWMIRNNLQGLNGNRYVDAMMTVNPWRPEEGTLTFGDFVARFFETLQMLVFKAIPNSIPPFLDVNYSGDFTVGCYCVGGVLLLFIVLGFWQMGRLRWFALAYLGATLGLISLFSSPSENRYLTTILPLLTTGAFWGLAWSIGRLFRLASFKWQFHPAWLCLLLLTATLGFKEEHKMSHQPLPLHYQQFFAIGDAMRKAVKKHQIPADAVVCSRKPMMFYMHSQMRGLTYKFTTDDKELIAHLVANKVDYVLLDNLGYSSTGLYLYPAIQKHPELFPRVLIKQEQTRNYLLEFDRKLATEQGF